MAKEEPRIKRQKLDIFEEFKKNERLIHVLRVATCDLSTGLSSSAQLLFQKMTEANARSRVSFTDATCDLETCTDPGAVPAGIFFYRGLAILKRYCDEKETEPVIPKDVNLQNCLAKLLEFLSSDNGALVYQEKEKLTRCREGKECIEGKWAVIVAQHLLSQLAIHSNYMIDRQYAHLDVTTDKCFCERKDAFMGNFNDTSYGCETGWSGRTDVILHNNIEIQFSEEEDEESISVNSSVEMNTRKSESQIVAQTVVFSFLERKNKKASMDNFLVPGIMIGKNHFKLLLYDSENDVLVSNLPNINLFVDADADLSPVVTLLLWLALNYKYLCSGVPPGKVTIDNVKADFFKRVDDHLASYQEKVFMPEPSRSSHRASQNQTWFPKLEAKEEDLPDIPFIKGTTSNQSGGDS